MAQVGYACGTCPRCGKEICRTRPADLAICDCWEYCPQDHGKGPYATKMVPYSPDMTPNTYGPIKIESGEAWGDLAHPMDILRKCEVCEYHSAQKPVEVRLS